MKENLKRPGFYGAILSFCSIATLIGLLIRLDAIPLRFIALVALIALLLFGVACRLFFKRPHTIWKNVFAWMIITPLTIAMLGGSWYVAKTNELLWSLSMKEGTYVSEVCVYVPQNSAIQSLQELQGKRIGYYETDEDQTSVEMLKQFKKEGVSIESSAYPSLTPLLDALKAKKVEAIIAQRPLIEALTQEDGLQETQPLRAIATKKVKVELNRGRSATLDVTKTPFTVLIMGTNEYGSVNENSANTVNILAVVNPQDKKILLVSLPKETYVWNNKLGYLGIQGTHVVRQALEQELDVPIDYTVRVNLTTMTGIVDQLGGIEIDNKQAFETKSKQKFEQGKLWLDAKQALTYVQECPNDPSNPNQGEMVVLSAMIEKILSSKALAHFETIQSVLGESIQTSMSKEQIGDLVKMQMLQRAPWTLEIVSVEGRLEEKDIEPLGEKANVLVLDDQTLQRVEQKIDAVLRAGS